MVLKELIFLQLISWVGVVVLKELFLTVSTLAGCGSLERTNSFTVRTFWVGVEMLERTDF